MSTPAIYRQPRVSRRLTNLHLSGGASRRCPDRMTYWRSVPTPTISKR
jgi:hypothetical protein